MPITRVFTSSIEVERTLHKLEDRKMSEFIREAILAHAKRKGIL